MQKLNIFWKKINKNTLGLIKKISIRYVRILIFFISHQ